MDSEDDVPIGRRMVQKQGALDSDDEPIVHRIQRKASVASREGIRKGVMSESSNNSDKQDESDSASDDDTSSADDKKRKRNSGKGSSKRVSPKKSISKVAKAKSSTKPTPKSTPKPAKKAVVVESEDEASEDENQQRVMRIINRSPKEQLVADLLCRWWYVLPDWPPVDFDYAAKLKEARLHVVSLDKWETQDDVDSSGFMKCYALTQYKGLFRDAQGRLNDMRPIVGKPCYSEFIKRSEKELATLLSAALTKQIEILSASPDATPLIAELKQKLKANKKYFQFFSHTVHYLCHGCLSYGSCSQFGFDVVHNFGQIEANSFSSLYDSSPSFQ